MNRSARRGVTLAESMIASVLLATCVVGISGALSASYQNQAFANARRAASTSGRKLMENLIALPMDPATAGAASLADFQQASATPSSTTVATTTPLGALLSSLTFNLTKFSAATAATTASTMTPAISVDRRASVNGATSTTGDFAIVTVAVAAQTSTTATSSVKFKRLVTSVEAAGNQAN